jgi:hypothetical protein
MFDDHLVSVELVTYYTLFAFLSSAVGPPTIRLGQVVELTVKTARGFLHYLIYDRIRINKDQVVRYVHFVTAHKLNTLSPQSKGSLWIGISYLTILDEVIIVDQLTMTVKPEVQVIKFRNVNRFVTSKYVTIPLECWLTILAVGIQA